MKKIIVILIFIYSASFAQEQSWIRINQLGYTPQSIKVAVWCSKEKKVVDSFKLIDAVSRKVVYVAKAEKPFGAYGPFKETYRLNFSEFKKPGKYYLQVDKIISPTFRINDEVYKGAADFCLQYMRQQRSGYNPFLNDSCHTHDGYVLYGAKAGIKDSTHIDVVGGWHDASDYLQYSTTSANATYHLLMAYRDFPNIFNDEKLANGKDGHNGIADVLDEAKWGLDWLLKMHPKENILFNQLGDDRDHREMRIPKEDTYYGKGFERPVYFIDGEQQQRGKFKNNTTGTSSTAAKFASAFVLGYGLFKNTDTAYAGILKEKIFSAYQFSNIKKGVTQTVSVLSPYIYAEDNWVDDMELEYALIARQYGRKNFYLDTAYYYALQEPVTPWLGKDTAKHYQWYPFINIGHYELAKQLTDKRRDSIIDFYKKGIELVWNKARQNAFYRAIPFIWCSNNLTTAFAQQCYWYEKLSNDKSFTELEQANIDWLFGCNPWGTSMVYGLPWFGDTPTDPHSAFTHLKNYPINGGLVDGPVYTSIYKNLIGIKLTHDDTYKDFQSDLAVYHDDYGDYSTNEPTMDGTASLIYLLAAKEAETHSIKKQKSIIIALKHANKTISHGAIVRGDTTKKEIALIFTGDEFGEGLPFIIKTLKQQHTKASFFFTGRFYRNKKFQSSIQQLYKQGNYLGPHSDQHLLYCDWNKRDSLLISYQQFSNDWKSNLHAMEDAGINTNNIKYFIPPYEWWNDSVTIWCRWNGVQLFNFTPGSKTNSDYTYPEMGKSYISSDVLLQHVKALSNQGSGLNGCILLIHAGTDARRIDKFYNRLDELIRYLKSEKYTIKKIDELLN